MSGNCLKGSRPLLSFDHSFDAPHWSLIKELLIQTFGTPNHHPKSQPFHDHVFTFTVLDEKIWFRNFEVINMDGKLTEIGNNDIQLAAQKKKFKLFKRNPAQLASRV